MIPLKLLWLVNLQAQGGFYHFPGRFSFLICYFNYLWVNPSVNYESKHALLLIFNLLWADLLVNTRHGFYHNILIFTDLVFLF